MDRENLTLLRRKKFFVKNLYKNKILKRIN